MKIPTQAPFDQKGLLLKLILFMSTITLVASCELPGHLLLVNQLEQNVVVKISSTEYTFDSHDIELPGKSKFSITYGHGFSWDESTFESYKSSIQSIVVISERDTTNYVGERIKYFFADGKRDVFNKRLTVKIDSSILSTAKGASTWP